MFLLCRDVVHGAADDAQDQHVRRDKPANAETCRTLLMSHHRWRDRRQSRAVLLGQNSAI